MPARMELDGPFRLVQGGEHSGDWLHAGFEVDSACWRLSRHTGILEPQP